MVVEDLVPSSVVETLISAVDEIEQRGDRKDISLSWTEDMITTMMNVPAREGALGRYIRYRPVLELAEKLVGGPARVTGGLLLDKNWENNFDIGWHHDSGEFVAAIPPGEPEDIRNGMPVLRTHGLELAQNVTVRLALEPSTAETGGLYLLPGSHKKNLGKGDPVKEMFKHLEGELAHQPAGSVLFYRPLTLHRSEKRTRPGRRRILHIKYGPVDLQLPGAEPYPWPHPCPLTPVDSLVEPDGDD